VVAGDNDRLPGHHSPVAPSTSNGYAMCEIPLPNEETADPVHHSMKSRFLLSQPGSAPPPPRS